MTTAGNDGNQGRAVKGAGAKGARAKRPRGPRKATPRHLENAALYYLQRFATSAENLRRVLIRKVERSARFHGTDADGGRAAIDDIVRRYLASGLLDDAAFARARAETLHRRGNSARLIRAKLRQKGVGADDIEAALAALAGEGGEGGDAELAAAVNFARRRRLGPFAPTPLALEVREKHLAALARAGFSYDTALRIIDADDAETLTDD